ncbi:MAG: STT3 domain-containing protein [Candidatus Bilamarchaeaceae archaeon]
MIDVNPYIVLAYFLLTSGIPGALVSFGLLKGKEELGWMEKALIGVGIGMIALPVLPFLAYLLLGIKYSAGLAWACIAVFYIIGIAVFVKCHNKEELNAFGDFRRLKPQGNYKAYIIPALLVLLVLANFVIRIQTLSPIYMELDPYYYSYIPYQLLTVGENPLDDKTAWYPEVEVNHRSKPMLSYMEAIWHSIYKGEWTDNYTLAEITATYPPIAAALAVFFLYLLVASQYRREFALAGAAIAGFAPIFVQKTFAGVMETQPYAFFALTFFAAMLAFAYRRADLKYSIIAGIAYFGVVLGSSSEMIAGVTLFAFSVFLSLFYIFNQRTETEEMKRMAINIAVISVIGVLATHMLDSYFGSGSVGLPSGYELLALLSAFPVAFAYYLRTLVKDNEMILTVAGGAAILCVLVFAFTPIGDMIKDTGKGALAIAEYNAALQRTVAEQGVTGSGIGGQAGFIGLDLGDGSYQGLIVAPLAMGGNLFYSVSSGALNSIFGTSVEFVPKEGNLLMAVIFIFILLELYAIYRAFRDNDRNMGLIFLALFLFPSFVGLNKAKYLIYVAFYAGAAVAIILGELERHAHDSKRLSEQSKQYVSYGLIGLAALLVLGQFTYGNINDALLFNAGGIRFQDNPMAAQPMLKSACSQLKMSGAAADNKVCLAAEDPAGYASKGVLYQFDRDLCWYSLVGGGTAQDSGLARSASLRCGTGIDSYWIESMEWIRTSTEKESRITSWWDYGHWENFFGLRNAVLRNEHLSTRMIGEIAHDYIDGTPEELAAYMEAHGSEYALFDVDLVMNGDSLGGKYGALNYLSCDRDNQTSVAQQPGTSKCELDHMWEMIYMPTNPTQGQTCVISESPLKTGVYGYAIIENEKGVREGVPYYCIGEATIATGEKTVAGYYLDRKDGKGNLMLNKGFLQQAGTEQGMTVFNVFYTKDKVWQENGTTVDGYGDRIGKGKFYDSNLYTAFFLKDLPGFDLVFDNGAIKIYKIRG